MKKLIILFSIFIYLPVTCFLFAQELGSFRGNHKISFPDKIQKLVLDPLAAGTYTVGNGGDFLTIDSAFNKLSIDGIAGPVTIELIDNLYTAPTNDYGFLLNGPVPGADGNNRVTIKPANQVTIEGAGGSVMTFLNTSYVTVDGVALTGSATLTFHAIYNSQFTWNDPLDFLNNSDHNVVQNITAYSDDSGRSSAGIAFWIDNSSPVVPDSNLIQDNFIKQSGFAIYVSAYSSPSLSYDNVVRNNRVGSETDSLINWGIQMENNYGGIIEGNVVQNLRQQYTFDVICPGINMYHCSNGIIRNNIVHNIGSHQVWGSTGIALTGAAQLGGYGNKVYNNMIYDIHCNSTNSQSRVTGIQIWEQNNAQIYFNSVYLSGTGVNHSGSAALYIAYNCSNADVKNNLLINTRDESPYCASAIYNYSSSNFTSDYNDLFYDDSYANNCLVRVGVTNYLTLADWRAAGRDLSSITEMPNFIEPDIHIDETIPTNIESHAVSISGIDMDIDGDSRNGNTPDIGADEFDGSIVGIKEKDEIIPIAYSLCQNFPNPFNPATTIGYGLQEKSNVRIIVLNAIGEQVAVVLNEDKEPGYHQVKFNAANLPSGVYFYQIKAGNFVETKKMILLK